MLAPPTASPQEKTLSRSVDPLPKISYKPFSKKTTFICKFCGGKGCKHENWLTYPASAIKGLNSDWITPNILATQRPSSRIIKEYNIIQEFTDAGINAIFNLQEPGEHPFCGDGIHPQSGFSYFPEEFYEHGIYYFNFGWKDMTATSTDIVLKILKQMSFSLANGNKIAIHCHAGRGRTGLIIAAWLIYNNNMTAKEAIKLVRSKRKGAIQNKSQEEVLFRLDKEIRESRLIFHPSPKYKLEDFLFHQKKLLPLSTDSETRFVPNLVLVCLERLETLVNSGICTPVDVALAFYNPNESSYYKGEWTNYHEKALKSIKEKINSGNFELSDVDDPRLLAQSLLDYFDNFASPAIRTQFIDAIHEQIHQQEKLTKEMKDQFFNKLDKKEFLLVECFARFFSKLIYSGDASPEHFRKAILRVCISLVLERKKWDKLFLKRSLLQEHNGDDRVTHLNVFILKWVENFSTSFTEYYMVNKSPLKLHEKFLEAQIERVHKKRGSYLEKVLNKAGANSARDSPDYSGNDEVKMVSLFPQIPVGYTENQSQQINQESGLNMETGNKIPSKKLLSPVNFEKRGVRLISPKYKDTLNMSDCPDSHLGYDSSAEVKSEGGGRRDSVDSTTFKVRVHSAFKPAKFAEESENQDKIPSSTFSPSKNRTRTVAHPRVSLMRGEENPFVPSDSNSNGNSNINKNYDDFFSNNLLATEETPRQSVGAVADDSDGVSSDISDKDRFEDLWKEIEGLSEKKQGVMLQRLLKIQQAKSGSI